MKKRTNIKVISSIATSLQLLREFLLTKLISSPKKSGKSNHSISWSLTVASQNLRIAYSNTSSPQYPMETKKERSPPGDLSRP